MADVLLRGVDLTPSQLAELRAIDTMYYGELASISRREATPDSEARRVARTAQARLLETAVARLRGMLREEQQPLFDRNLAIVRSTTTTDG